MESYMRYLFLIILFSSTILSADEPSSQDVIQIKSRYGFMVNRRASVNLNVFVDYTDNDGSPLLHLALAIQNDILSFQKEGTSYHASYLINCVIRQGEHTLYKAVWQKNIFSEEFTVTNSRRRFQYNLFTVSGVSFPDSQASYECLLQIRDNNSRKELVVKRTIKVPAVKNKKRCSGLAFLTRLPDSSRSLPLVPTTHTLSYHKKYWLYFHCPGDFAKDTLYYRLYHTQQDRSEKLIEQRKFLSSDSTGKEVYLASLPTDSLPEGTYRISVETDSVVIDKTFSLIWFEKPIYLYHPDFAFRTMKYLVPEKVYKEIKSKSRTEITSWFKEYWKKHDPTPGTDFNELMYVYFQRVDQANRKFSTRHKEGWETDRGHILLVYGPPGKIENRRYATQTVPYLVWIYNDSLKFVFIDKHHDGQFTLLKEKE